MILIYWKAIEEGKFNVGDKFYNEQLKMVFEVKRDNEEDWFLGSEVEFERDGFHIPSVANGHNGAGDPALQLQMKRLFGYSYEDYFKDLSYCGYNEISNYTECVSLPKQSFFWKSKYKKTCFKRT